MRPQIRWRPAYAERSAEQRGGEGIRHHQRESGTIPDSILRGKSKHGPGNGRDDGPGNPAKPTSNECHERTCLQEVWAESRTGNSILWVLWVPALIRTFVAFNQKALFFFNDM